MAATLDNQLTDNNDRIVRRQNKVISIKVPVDPHNSFNLLAEYLFESGLSESFTAYALLRDIIEHLLSEYSNGMANYEKSVSH